MSYCSLLLRPFLPAVLTLLTASLATSCADDSPAALKPELPAQGGNNLRSITHLGSVPSTYDWELGYSNGRLTRAKGIVRDPSELIDRSYSYTSQLSYTPHNVKVKNSSREDIKLTLNQQGLIQTMNVGRNIYNFIYGTDNRLIGWHKIIFEDHFGQAQQYKTSASIDYADGNLAKITYTEADNRPVTLTFTPSQLPNFNGLLPATASREMGCLGFEHLYYAGLLGRPTQNLVHKIHYEYDDLSKNHEVIFEYGTRGGNTVLCNYHTPNGSVASVSYGY